METRPSSLILARPATTYSMAARPVHRRTARRRDLLAEGARVVSPWTGQPALGRSAMGPWTRDQVLTLISILVAIFVGTLAIVVTVFPSEARCFLGQDQCNSPAASHSDPSVETRQPIVEGVPDPPSPVPTTPTPRASPSAQAGPAPVGTTLTGTWWHAATGSSAVANLWYFDPSDSSGATREYRSSGAGAQQSFAYRPSSDVIALNFPSGSQRTLRLMTYDPASDSLTIQLDGIEQEWVGCSSAEMPAAAHSTCP
jgi:hypothetical protein